MAIHDKRRTERIDELINELRDTLSERKLSKTVDVLVALEYRKERHGAWIFDNSYTGTKYVRYVCTACNHWQSAQRHVISEQIFYMNYCPFCGAQMDKPLRESL